MKKIKTLFKRQFENHKIAKCLNEVELECKWVLDGEGWATEKIDGTCCLVQDGKIYRSYFYKMKTVYFDINQKEYLWQFQ